MNYVRDLGRLLEVGSPEERREFLRSFVRRIVWDDPEITMEYTLPLPSAKLNLQPAFSSHFSSPLAILRRMSLSSVLLKIFV